MDIFNIIAPPNEAELSRLLRAAPLTGAVLRLTVERQRDELSLRRGTPPAVEDFEFAVDTIYTTRPTAILGTIMVGETNKSGRIDAIGDGVEEEQNLLTLTVID